jgi:hypothetical protein
MQLNMEIGDIRAAADPKTPGDARLAGIRVPWGFAGAGSLPAETASRDIQNALLHEVVDGCRGHGAGTGAVQFHAGANIY